jgi:hypothetical protein
MLSDQINRTYQYAGNQTLSHYEEWQPSEQLRRLWEAERKKPELKWAALGYGPDPKPTPELAQEYLLGIAGISRQDITDARSGTQQPAVAQAGPTGSQGSTSLQAQGAGQQPTMKTHTDGNVSELQGGNDIRAFLPSGALLLSEEELARRLQLEREVFLPPLHRQPGDDRGSRSNILVLGVIVETDIGTAFIPYSRDRTWREEWEPRLLTMALRSEFGAWERRRYHQQIDELNALFEARMRGPEGQTQQGLRQLAVEKVPLRNQLRENARLRPFGAHEVEAVLAPLRGEMDMPTYELLENRYRMRFASQYQTEAELQRAINTRILQAGGNVRLDRVARVMRVVGWVAFAADAGLFGYDLVTAPSGELPRTAVTGAGRILGGGAGGTGGAALFALYGAGIGTCFCPGVGTAIGGGGGAIFGSLLGGWAGAELGEAYGDELSDLLGLKKLSTKGK